MKLKNLRCVHDLLCWFYVTPLLAMQSYIQLYFFPIANCVAEIMQKNKLNFHMHQ